MIDISDDMSLSLALMSGSSFFPGKGMNTMNAEGNREFCHKRICHKDITLSIID